MQRLAFVLVATFIVAAGSTGCGSASPSTTGTPASSSLRTIAGYVVPWDARSGAAMAGAPLTEVSPVWYQPTPDGSLVFALPETAQSAPNLTDAAARQRLAMVPSISNYRDGQWDGQLVHNLITSPRLRGAHIAAIVQAVTRAKWAGIDLDYESLAASDRTAYSAFVTDLARALHDAGKKLTLTVHAKTAEPGDWSGARAQDWQALGRAADEVRVMAYDYSTDSTAPGPIAPIAWVEDVLRLAVTEIPPEKIVLGVAAYGYDWTGAGHAQDLQWADAEAIAHAHAIAPAWDTTSQSPYFTYQDDQGRRHTVWYEDARSLKAKLDLAAKYRVGGIVLWRLGGEDPAIWGLLK
jgi:spore germination protein YaaH